MDGIDIDTFKLADSAVSIDFVSETWLLIGKIEKCLNQRFNFDLNILKETRAILA